MTLEKLDFKKSLKALYTARQRVEEVDAPSGRFLAIDGRGLSPDGKVFEEAAGKLYPLAYTLKFARKAEGGQDFAVPPMEALWFDGPDVPMAQWRWRILIRVPDDVTEASLTPIRATVEAKQGTDTSDVRLITFEEGRCIQTLHLGPFDKVSEAYMRLGAHAEEHSLAFSGPGHEVYLSDPRRTAPEKLKTVVRMPVRPK